MDARNARRDLTLDELRGIIDALADAGCQHLVISGGEPFLRDDLAAIVAYVRERGIDFGGRAHQRHGRHTGEARRHRALRGSRFGVLRRPQR